MRKLILIAAMVLISASAQAGPTRGLTMASNDEQPAPADQLRNADPKATDTKAADTKATDTKAADTKATDTKADPSKADAPKFVERPAAVAAPADAPKADQVKPAPDKKAEKPRHRRESTEARVIYELHRHGIYW
jgi:chromatin remodeling complex protein RSC6